MRVGPDLLDPLSQELCGWPRPVPLTQVWLLPLFGLANFLDP
jgi:hypothetical protein